MLKFGKPISFSALQRAENSSIGQAGCECAPVAGFQCSSASRKFLNAAKCGWSIAVTSRFSALQRAENSSIRLRNRSHLPTSCFSALQRAENSSIDVPDDQRQRRLHLFQCSSASRKFLNFQPVPDTARFAVVSFSALQRAENSSIAAAPGVGNGQRRCFSALQRAENSSIVFGDDVPQRTEKFQCSSASRKFLNLHRDQTNERTDIAFQCSSASRKFLNLRRSGRRGKRVARFSALQRAENSSMP